MSEKKCPHCGSNLKLSKDQKSNRIKLGMLKRKAQGLSLGRKRKINYSQVLKLRDDGKSLTQIALMLKCTKRTVSNAIKESHEPK